MEGDKMMNDESKYNKRMDAVISNVMETLDLIATLRQQLDIEMSGGFISLAKSRYSMGNKSVSALQHDTRELVAITRVIVDEASEKMELVNLPTIVQVEVNDEEENCEIKPSQSPGLRARKNRTKGKEEQKLLLADNEDNETDEQSHLKPDKPIAPKQYKSISRDPLKMFGLLVPQSLRQAKTCFQRTLDILCEMADAQQKLESYRQEYTTLKLGKVELNSLKEVES